MSIPMGVARISIRGRGKLKQNYKIIKMSIIIILITKSKIKI